MVYLYVCMYVCIMYVCNMYICKCAGVLHMQSGRLCICILPYKTQYMYINVLKKYHLHQGYMFRP